MAAVIGEEYRGWLPRTLVYGLASTVSVSRVLSYNHFPSDVLVGSASGWLIGHYVYKAHHNFNLDPYDSLPPAATFARRPPTPPPPTTTPTPTTGTSTTELQQTIAQLTPDPFANRPPVPFDPDPDTIGSTNVPMDSWIYPALGPPVCDGLYPGTEHLHPTVDSAGMPAPAQACRGTCRETK